MQKEIDNTNSLEISLASGLPPAALCSESRTDRLLEVTESRTDRQTDRLLEVTESRTDRQTDYWIS